MVFRLMCGKILLYASENKKKIEIKSIINKFFIHMIVQWQKQQPCTQQQCLCKQSSGTRTLREIELFVARVFSILLSLEVRICWGKWKANWKNASILCSESDQGFASLNLQSFFRKFSKFQWNRQKNFLNLMNFRGFEL